MSEQSTLLPCGRPAQKTFSHSAEPPRQRLNAYMKEKGMKASGPRSLIAEQILKFNRHFSAKELVSAVSRKNADVGAATVYRTLQLLTDAGILTQTLIDDQGRVIYELDAEHHDHIICSDCGEIFEFQSPQIENLQDKITDNMEFQPVHHKHVIYAKCSYLKGRVQ